MVGGEESVPAVQHAGLAARPAGRQHGSPCADTAASARDRESGVADSNPLLQYTTENTQSHIPSLILSPVQVHFGMSLWTADRRNWSYCADTHRNCESAAIVTSLILALVHRRVSWYQFWLIINCFHVFFFSRTMKKNWCRRSFLLGRDVFDNFFTTKALFLGTPAKDQEKKTTQKPRTTIHFFFNKHFTRSQTLIACDRSSKVMFYILLLTIISVYSTNPHGFSFLISKLWFLNKQTKNLKGTTILMSVDVRKFGQCFVF